VPAAAQTYSTFDPIQFPGAGSTLPLAINDMGQIVGEVTSGAGQPPLILNGQDFWTTGFELDAGLYSLLYYPAAQITGANPGWPAGSANGINVYGEVVGGYATTASDAHGYAEQNGVYTSLGFAPAPDNFTPQGINDLGVTDGTCTNCVAGESSSAYIDDNGAITLLNVNGDGGATTAGGINNAGEVIVDTAAGTSMLYSAGAFTSIDLYGAEETIATAVNNEDIIVGSYEDGSGLWHGFVDNAGIFSTVDDPLGVDGTMITGINDQNQIVGSYIGADGVANGFTATADVQEPASVVLFGTSLIGLGWLWRRKGRPAASRARQPGREPEADVVSPAFENWARLPVSR